MNEAKQVTILDCTLRDGSYTIDYQFTAEDTAIIAATLEATGVEFIEIGHGLGLNATNLGKGIAAASDEKYLEAASRVLKKAKFGMFFIPGIGREEDLKIAASYGMDFVRIGTDITKVDESARPIEVAKSLGMFVSANLMKSYALPPLEFLKQAKKSAEFGVDILVVVDSAGGMLPRDISNYVSILKSDTGLPIGYHGHNNLGLATSNTLEAIRSGATMVDASLRGIGRSAGNVQIETLVLLLNKLGYSTGIDAYRIMEVAERLLGPMIRREQQGVNAIGAISGYAQFHSNFLNIVYKVAEKHRLDPRELIVKVSEIDRVNVSSELAEEIAQQLQKEKRETLSTRRFWSTNFDPKKETMTLRHVSVKEQAGNLARELLSLSKKTGKFSVITIASSPNPAKQQASFPFIRQNALCVIGNVEVVHIDEGKEIASAVDDLVDVILVDADLRNRKMANLVGEIRNVVKKSLVLTYKDADSLVSAADSFIHQIMPELSDKKIAILGDSGIACKLALKIAERGADVLLYGNDSQRLEDLVHGLNLVLSQMLSGEIKGSTSLLESSREADLLLGVVPYSPVITTEMLKVMKKDGIVLDVGVGTLWPEAIEYGISQGFRMYRLDMRAGLSGEITNVLETLELTSRILGERVHDNVRMVAGGVLGKRGDIIVDSMHNPLSVIGICDGRGGLLRETETREFQQKVIAVKALIINEMLDSDEIAY